MWASKAWRASADCRLWVMVLTVANRLLGPTCAQAMMGSQWVVWRRTRPTGAFGPVTDHVATGKLDYFGSDFRPLCYRAINGGIGKLGERHGMGIDDFNLFIPFRCHCFCQGMIGQDQRGFERCFYASAIQGNTELVCDSD